VLVIPEEPEINHIVVIASSHNDNDRRHNVNWCHSDWCHGVYELRKNVTGKWVVSNCDSRWSECRVEVDASLPDRIDIAIKNDPEWGRWSALVTRARRETPLPFFGLDSNMRLVMAIVISDSERDSLPFGNGERSYLVLRSDGATILLQNSVPDSVGLEAREVCGGRGLSSDVVEVRREESGIKVIWEAYHERAARLWNVNGNWVGVCYEGDFTYKHSLICMVPDPILPSYVAPFSPE